MLRRFLIALQFLTVFRFKNNLAETSADMAASMGWYPVVGFFLGGLVTLLAMLLGGVLPPLATGFLLALALALLTQGLHLDGLADTADGLFSHRDRDGKLAIMKDSRIGVFGAVALVLVLGVKASLLGDLARRGAYGCILLAPVWGRSAAAITACLSRYARPQGGLGKPFVDLTGPREFVTAALWMLAAGGLVLGPAGLVIGLLVILGAAGAARVFERQVGGVTGDFLGATIELGETLGLTAVTAALGAGWL